MGAEYTSDEAQLLDAYREVRQREIAGDRLWANLQAFGEGGAILMRILADAWDAGNQESRSTLPRCSACQLPISSTDVTCTEWRHDRDGSRLCEGACQTYIEMNPYRSAC